MPDLKKYRIVLPEKPTYNERRAADFITSCVKIVVGYKMPTVSDASEPCEYEICIGRTSREALDGLAFERCEAKTYEGLLFGKGNRIYMTGLGINTEKTDKPFKSYEYINDGQYGALYAAYRFVEDTVGYNFLYAVNESYPEKDTIEVDTSVSVTLTREYIENELPKKTSGDVLYSIPSGILKRNGEITVIRSKKGGLCVIGGGRDTDAEHLISVLEYLSDGKKPTVSAWLLSCIGENSAGALARIMTDAKLSSRINIEKIYGKPMSREFYTSYASDRSADVVKIFDALSHKITDINTGDIISLDKIKIKTMATPDTACIDKMTVGESSVIYRIESENKKVLIMGESGAKGSAAVLSAATDPKCDVLMLVNYGGRGIPGAFFKAASAKECVFSVCIRDLYGEYGEGLYTRNSEIIRTRDLLIRNGTVPSKQYRNTFGCVTVTL